MCPPLPEPLRAKVLCHQHRHHLCFARNLYTMLIRLVIQYYAYGGYKDEQGG